MSIADFLRERIRSCGRSRYHLSRLTGISESSLSKFIKGKRYGLSMEAIEKLATLLHLEMVQTQPPCIPPLRAGRPRKNVKE